MTVAEDVWALLIQGFVALCISWVIIFLVRLVGAPARLYAALGGDRDRARAEINMLKSRPSDLLISLHPKMAICVDTDMAGKTHQSRAFIARIANGGGRFLQKCQLSFGNHFVSGYFDLRPGEAKDLPVLWISLREPEPRPLVYFIDANGKIDDGSGWLPRLGDHEIKVFSADTHPALLPVRLSLAAAETPREWRLLPCN